MASYHNIDKNGFRKGEYVGYAGYVTYKVTGQSGDWRARLDSRYTDSLWAREGLAPMSFYASNFAELSATLERIERACATRPEGSPFHPDYGRESNPSQRTADDLIVAMHPFKASALTGDSDKRHRGTGRLSREAATLFLDAEPGPHGTGAWFVVSSYATPIAWYTATGGWCVIDKSALDGGSVTTSKHINLVKRALGLR
jgi:hypothetical protein